MRRHHFYTYAGSFTNLKRRQVEFSIALESDARYELHAIHHTIQTGKILFKLPDLSTSWIELDDFPWPLVPVQEYQPCATVRCAVSLPEDLNIGRRRPRFVVQLMGVKVYGR